MTSLPCLRRTEDTAQRTATAASVNISVGQGGQGNKVENRTTEVLGTVTMGFHVHQASLSSYLPVTPTSRLFLFCKHSPQDEEDPVRPDKPNTMTSRVH